MKDRYRDFYRKPGRTLWIRGDNLPIWYIENYDAIGRSKEMEQPLLIPISLAGVEGVGMTYRYEVLCRTDIRPLALCMPEFDHNSVVGSRVTVYIDVPGKGEFIPGMPGDTGQGNRGHYVREITGHISSAGFVREDDRAKVYRFVIEPPFANAKRGQDYRFFKECTVIDVLQEIMGRYMPYELRLAGPHFIDHYPRRDLIRQHFESDYDFFCRLCEQTGTFFWFEHSKGSCRMILADSMGAFHRHGEAYETLLYSTESRFDEEHIDRMHLASRVTEGKSTAVDHDPQRPRLGTNVIPVREKSENPRDTKDKDQEYYAYANVSQPLQGAMGLNANPNELDAEVQQAAMVRMQALRSVGLRATGHGYMRALLPGFTFELQGYPLEAANELYVVLRVKLTIVEVDQTSGTGHEFRCESEFEIQPWGEQYRMPLVTPWPTVVAERAIVTGYGENAIWTDAQGRIRLQLVPDRQGTFDQDSFIWVTPSQQWQNWQLGTFAVPRVGSEVIVGYINGNPDMPVVLGSVVNAHNMPAWELPRNQWLSGMRSKMDGGFSSNHLALDDTKDRQQAQLASDHAKSSLSLGYITRIDGNEGRQDARGEGFELRTDLWGAVRAKLGMLLSTHGRDNAAGKAKDMDETLARLTRARDVHETLTGFAQQHEAQKQGADQSDVTRTLKQQNEELRGTPSSSPDSFPEFSASHMTFASPAGIESTTAGSTHIQSDQDLAITTGRHVAIAAAKSLYASVLESIALFVRNAGMKLVAAAGKIHIEAQTDNVEIIARKVVELISTSDWINLKANQGVRINGGGSILEISGDGIVGYTGGQFLVHAASHATADPKPGVGLVPPALVPGSCVCPKCLQKAADVGTATLARP